MGFCCTDPSGHCCWFDGQPCIYVEACDPASNSGRLWRCSLRQELGSWEAVESDPRYQTDVKPKMQARSLNPLMNCWDWPGVGETCHCGEIGPQLNREG